MALIGKATTNVSCVKTNQTIHFVAQTKIITIMRLYSCTNADKTGSELS